MSLIRKQFSINDEAPCNCIMYIVQKRGADDMRVWFKAKDIALYLKYSNTKRAISLYVNEECRKTWKELRKHQLCDPPFDAVLSDGLSDNDDLSSMHPTTMFISKRGLYTLTARSKNPDAQKFLNWVRTKVLPSLRKTGECKLPLVADDQAGNADSTETAQRHQDDARSQSYTETMERNSRLSIENECLKRECESLKSESEKRVALVRSDYEKRMVLISLDCERQVILTKADCEKRINLIKTTSNNEIASLKQQVEKVTFEKQIQQLHFFIKEQDYRTQLINKERDCREILTKTEHECQARIQRVTHEFIKARFQNDYGSLVENIERNTEIQQAEIRSNGVKRRLGDINETNSDNKCTRFS